MQPQISTIKPRPAPAAPTAPRLERTGVASYHANDVAQLARWLEARGWQQAEPRSQHEFARYWLGARLLVCYRSGTVLIQGRESSKTHDLLAELVQS